MKNTNKEKVFEINLKNPFSNKTIAKILAGITVIGITSVGTYLFADNYTLEFRSPVIFQSPILVNEREDKVYIQDDNVNDQFTLEATSSAKVVTTEEISYVPSKRGLDCISNNPGLAGKLKEAFGEEWRQASELVCRESSFNHEAINPTSGACGLFQALPCSKMQCELDDVDCQIAWGKEYISKRYGKVEVALSFHDRNNWY